MIISTATKSLREKRNTDMNEKLACEIYELNTASGLPLVIQREGYTVKISFQGISWNTNLTLISQCIFTLNSH